MIQLVLFRGANMLYFIFIIAVTLPALCRGEATTSETCYSDLKLTTARKDLETHVENTLKSGWKPDSGNTLKEMFNNIIKTTAASCNQTTENRTSEDFMDIMKYTFTSDYLSDFVKINTGRDCMNSLSKNISNCVTKYVVEDDEGLAKNSNDALSNALLWKYSKLTWRSKSCSAANNVKVCSMAVIDNGCKPISNFVADLFNTASGRCEDILRSSNTPTEESAKQTGTPPEKSTSSNSSNTLVTLLFVIAIFVVLYILYQDWHFKRLPCMGRGNKRTEDTPLSSLNQSTNRSAAP